MPCGPMHPLDCLNLRRKAPKSAAQRPTLPRVHCGSPIPHVAVAHPVAHDRRHSFLRSDNFRPTVTSTYSQCSPGSATSAQKAPEATNKPGHGEACQSCEQRSPNSRVLPFRNGFPTPSRMGNPGIPGPPIKAPDRDFVGYQLPSVVERKQKHRSHAQTVNRPESPPVHAAVKGGDGALPIRLS